jgi:orotate phosphoribosyltransferase
MVNEIADLLKQHGAVEFGDFVLASGAKSTYYLDIKSAVTSPQVLGAIGNVISAMATFDVVAGVAVGGVPIAVATALASGRPYAIIRSADKGHGKKERIIGDIKGKKVLLVEDVTTSGGSALYGINELRAAGAVADMVITVVDRESGATEKMKERGVRLFSLVKASELLR